MADYIDIIPCGFFIFTDDGKIKEVNTTFCTLLEYEKEELEGKKLEEVFSLATRIFYQTHLFPLLKMQLQVKELFITLITKNKTEVPVLLNASRVQNENGTENICICMPVYNRKKYEDEILEAKRKAEKAVQENKELLQVQEKLQKYAEDLDERIIAIEQSRNDIAQFNRVVTHDLQEPLRKILVFVSLLQGQEKHNLSAETKELIQKISGFAHLMKDIILGLQQYVWLLDEDKKATNVDINKLLLVVERQLINDFGKDVLSLTVNDIPAITGFWDQLFLLFYQLIQNAIKYREPGKGAEVTVTGTIVQENRFRKIKDKFKYEDYLRIEVKDNGVGFDAKHRKDVFNLFTKLHFADSGLGLGLALCKKVMDNHSGFITAESTIHKGSSFFCFFPMEKSSSDRG